jgi:hypothetical protein
MTKGRADQCNSVVVLQRWVGELEQDLKLVHEEAAADKKKLEDELLEEKHKNQEADALLNTVSTSKTNCFTTSSILVLYI